jgi:hypothetical protein
MKRASAAQNRPQESELSRFLKTAAYRVCQRGGLRPGECAARPVATPPIDGLLLAAAGQSPPGANRPPFTPPQDNNDATEASHASTAGRLAPNVRFAPEGLGDLTMANPTPSGYNPPLMTNHPT